ncbi:MAG: hypothetical protein DRN96_08165 [Thermoproteota archaeon]|nr:MAG: hypothetical protein DRN96_08165 [Candidatus Korarchaeota archaeon]
MQVFGYRVRSPAATYSIAVQKAPDRLLIELELPQLPIAAHHNLILHWVLLVGLLDFFTHLLVGRLIGLLGDERSQTAAALAAALPDLDVILMLAGLYVRLPPLATHRGLTHSVFTSTLLAAAATLAGVLTGYFKPAHLPYAVAGALSHITLDYLTTGGIPVFYPLSARRYAADLFYYIDPLVAVASFPLSLALAMRVAGKRAILAFSLYLLAYGAARLAFKLIALRAAASLAASRVYPTPLPNRWLIPSDKGLVAYTIPSRG